MSAVGLPDRLRHAVNQPPFTTDGRQILWRRTVDELLVAAAAEIDRLTAEVESLSAGVVYLPFGATCPCEDGIPDPCTVCRQPADGACPIPWPAAHPAEPVVVSYTRAAPATPNVAVAVDPPEVVAFGPVPSPHLHHGDPVDINGVPYVVTPGEA